MQRNRRRPKSTTNLVNDTVDILMASRPSNIITLDIINIAKAEDEIYYIAVNTLGWKFEIPSSKITKYQDFYKSSWTQITGLDDSVINTGVTVYFKLLNHSIDANGTLRKRRETEKYKEDLAKWQYATKFNVKARLLQNGEMILVNDKLMYGAPKGCVDAIVPPKAEIVDFKDLKYNSNFKSVRFMSKIIIPDGCFEYCTGLANVEIHNGTSAIGNRSFSHCIGLEQIVIPESVHKIGSGCFNGCTNLKSIVFEGTIKYIGARAFKECQSLEEINLPNGLSKIDKDTFFLCSSLRKVYIPRTVKEIEKRAFYSSGLQEIYVPETLKGKLTLETRAKIIFYK